MRVFKGAYCLSIICVVVVVVIVINILVLFVFVKIYKRGREREFVYLRLSKSLIPNWYKHLTTISNNRLNSSREV